MLRHKINKISEIDIAKLSDFYKKIYYKRYKSLASNYRWWYRVGYNEFEPLVLSVDNKVIGQAGLLPIDLRIKEKKVPAIWFVDFAILPEFQGKGFGQILTREWMKICPNQMTFCNNKSLKIFIKFGWKKNLLTKRFVKPINPIKFLPIFRRFKLNFVNKTLRDIINKKFSRNVSIKPHSINGNFKIINDSFKIKKLIKSTEVAEIIRDEEWLHWRLVECPYKKDIHFFEYKNNFAIVHIFTYKNIRRFNFLYTYYTDTSHEDELMVLILNWAINNHMDLIWMVNKDKKFENIFPPIFSKTLKFASWSSDEKILEILQHGLLDLQGIDTDTDSCLYVDES